MNNKKLRDVDCGDNRLTALYINTNPNLRSLYCSNNSLPGLDFSKNDALETISIDGNPGKIQCIFHEGGLENIIAKNLIRKYEKGTMRRFGMRKKLFIHALIFCMACVLLLLPKRASALGDVNINATNFPDGIFRDYVRDYLDTDKDKILSEAERLAVEDIYVGTFFDEDDKIASLKGIEYFPNLTELNCDGNQLTSLNLSGNTNLKELSCGNNPLKTLDLSGNTNLEELSCVNCQLTSLNITKCKKLRELICYHNQLTELDISNNTKLETLDCSENRLIALYIDKNPELEYLDCSKNQLPGLDPSKNAELSKLFFEDNPGKKINIYNTALGARLREELEDKIEIKPLEYADEPVPGTLGFHTWEPSGEWWFPAVLGSFDEEDVVVALDTPSVTAANTGSGIKVSWNKISGAAEYEVWRALKGSTNYKLLKTAAGTSYTDKTAVTGKAYTYRICAKNSLVYSKNAAKSITRCPFTDVSEKASYFNAVIWAVQNGITSGTSATTFSPNAACTRYQFAVMLYKLAGKPAASGTLPFKDVKKTDSYYNAVLWAYTNGIISGTSKTTFSPKSGVTRYQVVQMLYKYVGKPAVSGTLPFKDVSTKSSYYNAVRWAVQNGITKGTDKTHFSPKAVCRRYQLVVFLYKFNNIYHIK